MTIFFSTPVRSTEWIGGKCSSNRISTTLPRTETTAPKFDNLVLFSMSAPTYPPSSWFRHTRLSSSCPFHRGIVFATARSPVASGSMNQSLLCRQNVGLLALPNLQSRLLDGAGKRKRQRPRRSRLESDIHGIQTGRGPFTGLAARQERN